MQHVGFITSKVGCEDCQSAIDAVYPQYNDSEVHLKWMGQDDIRYLVGVMTLGEGEDIAELIQTDLGLALAECICHEITIMIADDPAVLFHIMPGDIDPRDIEVTKMPVEAYDESNENDYTSIVDDDETHKFDDELDKVEVEF